jgi:hypothetical protein
VVIGQVANVSTKADALMRLAGAPPGAVGCVHPAVSSLLPFHCGQAIVDQMIFLRARILELRPGVC